MKSNTILNKYHSKKLSIILTLIGISLLSTVQAEINLLVDDHIKVTAINGQAVNTSFLKNPKKQYTLQAGQHVITAKYSRLYDLSKDSHDFVRSGNITISAKMDDKQTYRLVMPNQPEQYAKAKKFAKSPTLAIMHGNQVIASQNSQSSGGGLLSGVSSKIGGWFGGNKAVQANTQTIAAINNAGNNNAGNVATTNAPINSTVPNTPTLQTNTNTSAPTATRVQSGNVLDQFMQLWLQASPEERERIRGWVAQ